MSEAKYTPGPWTIKQDDEDSPIELCMSLAAKEGSSWIAIHGIELYEGVYPENKKDFAEAWANARLIAAAPELLAALRRVIEGKVAELQTAIHPSGRYCYVCGVNSRTLVHAEGCPVSAAEAAIAKAEGRA